MNAKRTSKKNKAPIGYWQQPLIAWRTLARGAALTWKHLLQAIQRPRRKHFDPSDKQYFSDPDGIATMRYPYEAPPLTDHGRYRLHNEIEDCIVCDKCADVCPVDCIEIESVRSTEGTIRKASDGTAIRLYATKFNIDMAKCCYCGLCTVVCPTECLTMTKAYDYSEVNVAQMIYAFSDLSPEEVQQKKAAWAAAEAEKKAKTAAPSPPSRPQARIVRKKKTED
ncbi:MAG: 4Fe-4S binding protein [Bernardetiaceae bacterium]